MTKKILYQCWTKAIENDQEDLERSIKWTSAYRGWFKIYGDKVECGKFIFKFNDIKKAVIYRTKQMLIPVSVLQITTKHDQIYQFGFNPWANPFKYLPIKNIEEKKSN